MVLDANEIRVPYWRGKTWKTEPGKVNGARVSVCRGMLGERWGRSRGGAWVPWTSVWGAQWRRGGHWTVADVKSCIDWSRGEPEGMMWSSEQERWSHMATEARKKTLKAKHWWSPVVDPQRQRAGISQTHWVWGLQADWHIDAHGHGSLAGSSSIPSCLAHQHADSLGPYWLIMCLPTLPRGCNLWLRTPWATLPGSCCVWDMVVWSSVQMQAFLKACSWAWWNSDGWGWKDKQNYDIHQFLTLRFLNQLYNFSYNFVTLNIC